jgi:hypothetical protein
MAKFTVTKGLDMVFNGESLIGVAGATHRIPDAHYNDFIAKFVTNKDSTHPLYPLPGLTWLVDDEIGAVGGGTPSDSVVGGTTFGISSSAGTATAYSRGDHGHGTPTDPVPAHAAAGDPHTAYALDTDLTTHEGAADPHAGYRLESADHTHASTGLQAGTIDHGVLTGLTDDDHTQYQRESEKGAANGYASLGADGLVPQEQLGTGTQDGTKFLRDDGTWAVTSGTGAPTDADYLVGTAHAGLSAEIVVGTSPGGELGGTWGSPTVDTTHSGSSHAGVVSTHEAAADPHTVYLKESDFDDIDFLVGTATGFTAAEIVVGTAPGGELGGTWASPTVDATHSGSAHHTQAHTVTGADHTATGLTSGQIMQATGTASFAFAATTISRGGTVVSAAITAATNVIVWRAPFACTVTAVKGYRVGGTGATINARKNGASNHLSSALSLTSADTWMDGVAVSNTAYAAGDKLEIMVVTATGSPTQLAIQVDFTRP